MQVNSERILNLLSVPLPFLVGVLKTGIKVNDIYFSLIFRSHIEFIFKSIF
ncbi:hypothetical protein FM106_32230 [Brachybacterium faecium]|nr:hypothetical protein FM106_32230 [Brachybacterium faecium]